MRAAAPALRARRRLRIEHPAGSRRRKTGRHRRLPIVREGKLIRILSEYDLRPYLESLDTTVVLEAMTPDPITISPAATLEHAVALLKGKEIGALPVVNHGRLIGIITASNLWFPELRPLPEWVSRTWPV